MLIFNFSAIHLPASSGELVEGAWRADSESGDRGNLTYGPYIPLAAGLYRCEMEYAAGGIGRTEIGAWDVYTSARGGTTLGVGSFATTGGRLEKAFGEFEVPARLAGEKFEIRTHFHGAGFLEIRSIALLADDAARASSISFGDLRRLAPISTRFGFDRGQPIDRFYIAEFLAEHSSDIKGRVLEVGDRHYTRRYGGRRVTKSDVLLPRHHADATIIADLADAPQISDAAFDCVILTQVLLCIYDFKSAVATIHRILKPAGVVLLTLPGITKVEQQYDWPFLWSFTEESARRLFTEAFGQRHTKVQLYGNVLAAAAFLYGLSFHELEEHELRHVDPNFQVTIGVRAVKAPVEATWQADEENSVGDCHPKLT